MPNQIPYGFYNPNMNFPEYNQNQGYSQNKLRELEERIRVLEEKMNSLGNNNMNEYDYKYDYKTSMHMM